MQTVLQNKKPKNFMNWNQKQRSKTINFTVKERNTSTEGNC